MKCIIKIIERFLFVILFPVMIAYMFLSVIFVCLLGCLCLPLAALKFIITGDSGIEWYCDTVLDWTMDHVPLFMLAESMENRADTE